MVIATTGGGASVIGELLRVPGGSASVLEAIVPYSWQALVQWLGGAPDQACSERTARAMAMAAFSRAKQLAEPTVDVERLLGIGCTASLSSDRPKRGAHRFHIAVQSASCTTCYSVELAKDKRSRAEEESLVCDGVISAIAAACDRGIEWNRSFAALSPDDIAQEHRRLSVPAERQLLLGDLQAIRLCGGAPGLPQQTIAAQESLAGKRYLLPGAFNPVHEGHRQMTAWVEAKFGAPVEYELSIENVAKPPLDFIDVAERLAQFLPVEAIWLTRAPTFIRKSAIFPGATFVVGIDTIVRVADPKFAGSPEKRSQEIATIAARGCRFLVFGRATAEGEFQELNNVELPPALRAICDAVPRAEFRADISSTALRRQQAQQQQ